MNFPVTILRAARTAVPLAAILAGLLLFGHSAPAPAAQTAPGVGPSPRIIGGATAAAGTWPSQALVLVETGPSEFSLCGGTLVDPSWVLTAAHCVTDASGNARAPEAVRLAIGVQDLSQITPSDRRDAAEVEVHPRYVPAREVLGPSSRWTPPVWDFALLRLATSSRRQVTPLIQPSEEPGTAGGKPARIAGWGCVTGGVGGCDQAGGFPERLQEARVAFVSDAVCASQTSWSANFDAAMMICAGSFATGEERACLGDSGGPLTAVAGGRRILAGVTSFGSSDPLCTGKRLPSVFARVSAGRPWIESTMGRRANLSRLALAPGRSKVVAGRQTTLRVTVTNTGDAAGTALVRLSSGDRSKVRTPSQVRLEVDANGIATGRVPVRTVRGRTGRVTIEARLGSAVADSVLTVKR